MSKVIGRGGPGRNQGRKAKDPSQPRRPDNITETYVRGGVNLIKPTTNLEKAAVEWWQELGPDLRLEEVTKMFLAVAYWVEDSQ